MPKIDESEEKLVEFITPDSYLNLKSKGIIKSGMIPKIDNCFNALVNGVEIVKIGRQKLLAEMSLILKSSYKMKKELKKAVDLLKDLILNHSEWRIKLQKELKNGF